MSTAPASAPDAPAAPAGGGFGGWWRVVVLGLACVVIGFAAGYVVRGEGGGLQVPPAPVASEPEDDGGAGPVTVTADEQPVPPPARADVQVAVLNGTDINGLAGRTADEAESLGYRNVIAGNTPEPNAGTTTVYFRKGERRVAERVAEDLGLSVVQPLPAEGPLATGAPAGASVVVVLGAT